MFYSNHTSQVLSQCQDSPALLMPTGSKCRSQESTTAGAGGGGGGGGGGETRLHAASLSDLIRHNPTQGLRLIFREITRRGDKAGSERDQGDNDCAGDRPGKRATEAQARGEGWVSCGHHFSPKHGRGSAPREAGPGPGAYVHA